MKYDEELRKYCSLDAELSYMLYKKVQYRIPAYIRFLRRFSIFNFITDRYYWK